MNASTCNNLEALPVELIAEVLSRLDLAGIIASSTLSRRFRQVIADGRLNPWRQPLSQILDSRTYPSELASLSARYSLVPSYNWIDILSRADAAFLLFRANLPHLRQSQWQHAFERRFLPGWRKWKRSEMGWQEAFMRTVARVCHRLQNHCTAEEAWTKYIVLNRTGSANELEVSSRTFDPIRIFDEMKYQANLAQLNTVTRTVLQLTDVRIVAIGVLNNPRGPMSINKNAKRFLHPPNIEQRERGGVAEVTSSTSLSSVHAHADEAFIPTAYCVLKSPCPDITFQRYPRHTASGYDRRWILRDEKEEGGLLWVGGLLLVAQLMTPPNEQDRIRLLPDTTEHLQPNSTRYASFTWADLWAIAPWMKNYIHKCIDGAGLGLD